MADSRLDATVDEIFRAHVQRYERRMRILSTEGRTNCPCFVVALG